MYVKINRKKYLIHRLIAVAFGLRKEEGQTTVDHRDGNRGNNRLENLRWATHSGFQGAHDPRGRFEPPVINRKSYQLHRLMAFAFGLEKESQDQTTIDHIDGNKSNNRLENLRWASPSQQRQFSEASGTRASNASRRSKPVLGRKHGVEEEWVRYASAREAARDLGVSQGSIPRCCGKEGRTAGGYEFKYTEGNEPDVLLGEVWITKLCKQRGFRCRVHSIISHHTTFLALVLPVPMFALSRPTFFAPIRPVPVCILYHEKDRW